MASTKNHSQLNLAKEKRKLFTAFLAMLGLLFSAFAVISGAFYSARYDENNEGTKKIITNVIEANKTDLAMELFVKQTAAFDLRLQNLRDKLKSMIQDPDLCLVDIQGVLVAQTYPGCSSLINNSGNAIVHPIIEAESKVGTIYVNYRNPFDLSSFLTDYKWYIATICAGFLIALLALIGFFKKYMGRVFERVTEFERHASMGQTAHMLAHDIQTPLNVLQHGLNIIADSSDTDKIKRVAATTLPAVEKAKLQIQNMLADLREVGASTSLEPEDLALEGLIGESLSDLTVLFDDLEIDLKYDLCHTRVIIGDKYKLSRVFGNILVNAVQAMESEGTITISSKDIICKGENFIEISILNTGSFISNDHLPLLFNKQYTSGKSSGNGLGLAIVKKIINRHGGEIRCESTAESGTSFTFTLPSKASKIQNGAVNLPSSLGENNYDHSVTFGFERGDLGVKGKKPLTVLIADDDPFFLRAISDTITSSTSDLDHQFDLKIESARNSDQIFKKVKTHQPDIIFLDIDLGSNSLNGHQVLERLRGSGVKSLIVVNTNSGSNDDRARSHKLGADAHFQKPIDRTKLTALFAQHTTAIRQENQLA